MFGVRGTFCKKSPSSPLKNIAFKMPFGLALVSRPRGTFLESSPGAPQKYSAPVGICQTVQSSLATNISPRNLPAYMPTIQETPEDQERGFYSGCDSYQPDRIMNQHNELLTPKDKELIKNYIAYKQSTRHVSDVRARKILFSLIGWKNYLATPFIKLTIDDVYRGITEMKNGHTYGGPRKGKPLAPNTQVDMIKILKPFLRWMIKQQGLKIPLDKIYDREDGIKSPKGQKTQITSSMILTVQEVMDIIKAGNNRREQAIFATLYESGCRIGELGRLRWKDVVFDDYGIKLYIRDRKANQKRYNRLTSFGKPALAALRDSLEETDPEQFVFVDDEHNMIKYKYCDKILKKAAKKVGIKKRVTLHLLRHCRATHMKAQGFSDSSIKKALWNNEKTDMWDIYVNLSEDDQDGEYLRIAGIDKEERRQKAEAARMAAAQSRSCYKCGQESLPNAEYCWKCGEPLNEDAAKRKAEMRQEIKDYIKELMEQNNK